jgi:ABC-type sugar transport system ATPase subunit
MPKKKAFDANKLVKMVKDETQQQEIMKAFGFKTAAQVKAAYFRALVESGEIPGIVGSRGGGKVQKAKTVGVGKRGSIVISKDLVEGLGVSGGEKFAVRKTKAGIALKRI